MPWDAICLTAAGDIKPCCQYSTGRNKNTQHDTIIENFNSDKMQSLREKFLNGEEPVECGSCWKREELIGKSRRLWFDEKFEKYTDPNSNHYTKTIVENPQFIQADINFSNVCNLKCRMCGSWGSNQWFDEEIMLAKADPKFQKNPNPVELQQYTLEDIQSMFPHMESIKRIDFKGGEPMLAKAHTVFLQWLIDNGRTDVQLNYTTNGTVRNPNIINMLSKFDKVVIIFSIEGTGDLYQYIRGGEYNLKHFEETVFKYNDLENVSLGFNVTLQNYNLLNLKKLHSYLFDLDNKFHNVDARSAFNTICNNPSYLSPINVPDSIRDIALEQLSDIDDFANLCNSLKSREFESDTWNTFVKFTKILDKNRGENFLDIEPIYTEYFNE